MQMSLHMKKKQIKAVEAQRHLQVNLAENGV